MVFRSASSRCRGPATFHLLLPMPMFRFQPAWLLLLALCASGCDNVGRAWDPILDPGTPEPGDTFSAIQVVPTGGDARDGRPKVRATFPSEGGWPLKVPIVVEFSESVNEASILPTTPTGTDARVIVRVRGTPQPIPCQYDFLAGGRLLIMRPIAELSNAQNQTYEVLLLPDARDVDGVRFQVESGGKLLSEFQVNQDEQFTDGRILTTFPRDNASGVQRETDYIVVFDRPANPTSVQPTNLFLRPAGGSAIAGDREFPLLILNLPDPRVVVFNPDDSLDPATGYELVVDDTITFPDEGELDFRGRTPFARFDTTAPAAPTLVELGNPLPNYLDKINQTNLANAILRVTPPADAAIGDRVRARVYGFDADTTPAADITFVEAFADLTNAGAQPVDLDLSGALGTLEHPKFDDGPIVFVAQMQRGSGSSGFVRHAQGASPRFDITLPTLTRAGPPSGGNATDILSDVENVSFYGKASEDIAEASLVAGTNPAATLFASDSSGNFLMRPVAVGRLSTPLAYSLHFTDRAGNVSSEVTGNIVMRGFFTGLVAGALTVEAYDQTTLLPIAGATVLVDPGAPTVPASPGQAPGTTDSAGRATFTVSGTDHTITIVRAGYDLVTLYRTGSAFVSLPLRPTAAATATLKGTVAFQSAPGTTVVVGSSALDSRNPIGVNTTSTAPNTIPDNTPIVPNRPQVMTAFGGVIEPTGAPPAFSSQGCQMLGATLQVPTPPTVPAGPGAESQQSLALVPTAGFFSPVASYQKDFGLAAGLNTSSLVGGKPVVRVTMSLLGFEGQVLAGLGSATAPVAASYTINADLGAPAALGLASFGPLGWVVAEARDTGERVSRHRALLDLPTGAVTAILDAPSIPIVTAPVGAITGSPAVSFDDVLFAAAVPGGQGMVDLTAKDGAGRRWVILFVDRDAAGGTDTLQYPDLATAGVAGLQTGTWSLQAEARLLISLTLSTSDDLMLTERVRQEILYSRSAPQPFTIQ